MPARSARRLCARPFRPAAQERLRGAEIRILLLARPHYAKQQAAAVAAWRAFSKPSRTANRSSCGLDRHAQLPPPSPSCPRGERAPAGRRDQCVKRRLRAGRSWIWTMPAGIAAAVDHEQCSNLRGIDDLQRSTRQHAGRNGLRRPGHDLARRPAEQARTHIPPQIAVGKDACKLAVIADDAKAAEALLRHHHERAAHRLVRAHHRQPARRYA